ncbi:MAG: hypothetical protein K2P86_12190 [Xanthobacteraceae bacterium]|jgi:hypothetical protein|nr:hypothetical protein [Xanthobacteraceae bacterium]
MNYQDAIERAIALRLRAKKENDNERRQKLLALAQGWEAWAEYCREHTTKGETPNAANRPAEDI